MEKETTFQLPIDDFPTEEDQAEDKRLNDMMADMETFDKM